MLSKNSSTCVVVEWTGGWFAWHLRLFSLALTMIPVFCNMTPCVFVYRHQFFSVAYCILLLCDVTGLIGNVGTVEELKTNLMSLVIFISFNYLLNMFRTLICPFSGACDCVDGLLHRSSCSQFVMCWSFCCGWYLVVSVLQVEALVLQPAKRTLPNIIRYKPQHTTITEQCNRCGKPSV